MSIEGESIRPSFKAPESSPRNEGRALREIDMPYKEPLVLRASGDGVLVGKDFVLRFGPAINQEKSVLKILKPASIPVIIDPGPERGIEPFSERELAERQGIYDTTAVWLKPEGREVYVGESYRIDVAPRDQRNPPDAKITVNSVHELITEPLSANTNMKSMLRRRRVNEDM